MITLSSITPANAPAAGGYAIRVVGDFSDHLGELFQVHIGPNGNATDTPCLSGITGSPDEVVPLNDTVIRCYTPALDPGTYDVFVRRTDDSTTDVLASAIQIFKDGFETSVYDLRRVLPPYYIAGPRSIEDEEPV